MKLLLNFRTSAYTLLALTVFLIFCDSSSAKIKLHEGIFLDGYIRPRIEFDDRDFNDDTGFDQYSTLRTRIGLRIVDIIPDTEFYVLIGDSRTMGYNDPYDAGLPEPPNSKDENLGVVKAYILINNFLAEGAYLKIGRMSNDQGRSRLFGPGNWNFNGPRTYDGIKAGYKTDSYEVNVWNFYGIGGDRHWYADPASFPDYSVPDPEIDYKYDNTLTGVDVRMLENKLQFLSFLDYDQKGVLDVAREEKNPAVVRYTFAVSSVYNTNDDWKSKGGLYLALDLAYQTGTMGTEEGEAYISAWLVSGALKFSPGSSPVSWVGTGWDITSGDDDFSDNDIKYFYDYYYSRHSYRGHMDLFKNPYGKPALGLKDIFVNFCFTISKNIESQVDVHYFMTEEAYPSFDDDADAHKLGTEIDWTTTWKIRQGLSLETGIDIFAPNEDWMGTTDNSNFIYSSLTAVF